jgi:hypothetical protein
MSYIGQGLPTDVFSGYVTDTFTGDGSATTFTLSKAPFSEDSLIVVVDNVIQQPTTNFTVSGTTLTIVGTAILSGIKGYAIHTGGPLPITTASKVDVNGLSDGVILDADADTTISADTDDRIDFKAGGSDIVHIFGNGNVSIGTTDDNAKLQIRKADSSVSPNSDADEFFIENNGNTGITIGSSTTGTGNIHFGDSGDTDRALISYSHNTDHMTITHEGDESIVMGGGRFQTGGETSGGVSAGGICANQGASDTAILNFKSSDIAHGVTGETETDTFAEFKKLNADAGGLQIRTFTEDVYGFYQESTATNENTTTTVNAIGNIHMKALLKSGTSRQAMSADANLFVVANSNTKFIVKGDGDIYYDGADQGAYDTYEDAQLVRAYDKYIANPATIIDSKFDQYIKYNKKTLEDAQLIGVSENGEPPLVSLTGFQRLHNGAIWQQYEKHQKLAEAVYEMAKEALGEEKADAILEKHDIKLLN